MTTIDLPSDLTTAPSPSPTAERVLAPGGASARAALSPVVVALAGDLLFLGGTYLLVAGGRDLHEGNPLRLATWTLTLLVVWLPLAFNQRAYHDKTIGRSFQSPYIIAKTTLLAGAIFHLIPLVGGPIDSRVRAVDLVLTLVGVLALWRFALSRVAPHAEPQNLVIVGTDWAGEALLDASRRYVRPATRVLAYIEDRPDLTTTFVHGVPVFPIGSLRELVYEGRRPAKVVLTEEYPAPAILYDHLSALAQDGVEIVSMASVYEELTGRIPVRHLGNAWWAALPRPSEDLVYLAMKRALDILFAAAGLLVFVLVLPLVAPFLKREVGGSLLFPQLRIGRYARPLSIRKLRTLPVVPAPGEQDVWARKRANRPGPVGAFLRATGIDELPQCWNILRGEMSLVGPRPYVLEEVSRYQELIPFFRTRSLVKPGLTGWAQINWGYGQSLTDEVEKLQFDLFYVGRQCLYLDLLILLRTAQTVLTRRRFLSMAPAQSAPVEPLPLRPQPSTPAPNV